MRSIGATTEAIAQMTQAYQSNGMPGYWKQYLEHAQLKWKQEYVEPYWIAIGYAGIGDDDQVFKYLEQACQQHSYFIPPLRSQYCFFRLHSDPRFTALVKKMGLE